MSKPLTLVEDERLFKYPNYHQHPEQDAAFCWLRLYLDEELGMYVGIVTELPENQGLSVTNGAERIATLVCKKHGIHPDRYVQIEHYLTGRCWDPDAWQRREMPETFTRHHFTESGRCSVVRNFDGRFNLALMFRGYEAEFLTREAVENLLGQPVEDRP